MRLICFLLFLLVIGCHPRPGNDVCDEMVAVIDYSQLDGCGYLLLNESGEKLLAVNAAEFELQQFARVQISYRTLVDMSSICMSEDKIVEITCFSSLNSVPRKLPCREYSGIDEGGWLESVANEWKPQQVLRYNYLDGFAYFCKKGNTTKIYDCQGTLLCTLTPTEDCEDYVMSQTEETVIWNSHR